MYFVSLTNKMPFKVQVQIEYSSTTVAPPSDPCSEETKKCITCVEIQSNLRLFQRGAPTLYWAAYQIRSRLSRHDIKNTIKKQDIRISGSTEANRQGKPCSIQQKCTLQSLVLAEHIPACFHCSHSKQSNIVLLGHGKKCPHRQTENSVRMSTANSI